MPITLEVTTDSLVGDVAGHFVMPGLMLDQVSARPAPCSRGGGGELIAVADGRR